MIMPLAEFGSLRDVLQIGLLTRGIEDTENRRAYVAVRILRMGSQIAHGLYFAHTRDPVVIHADIKPENVLVMCVRYIEGIPFDSFDVRICDFNICGTLAKVEDF